MATSDDDGDGLDELRRDLIDLVLREAGGRVAADPNSPVARLLGGIVHREMEAAVEALRQGGALDGLGPVASEDWRPSRSEPVRPAPNRLRDALLIGAGTVAALALAGGGFVAGGGLERLSPPAPDAIAPAPTLTVVDPADAPPAGEPATTDGMVNQLREPPR